MRESSGERRAVQGRALERAILLQLLSGERGQRRSQEELAAELGGETQVLEEALGRLCDAGVVCVAGSEVWASAAAWRIDELGLIAI